MIARCVLWVAALAVLSSCTGSRDAGENTPSSASAAHATGQSLVTAANVVTNVVTIVATDYAFAGPASVPAGLTTLQLANHGQAVHMMGITRLDNGKSIPELVAILGKNQPQPAWAVDLGGPNAVSPGDTSNSTLMLTPGHYLLICWVPAADGSIHFMKGMFSQLDVTESRAATAGGEPAADIVIHLADYRFDLSRPITAGRHTFRVENAGPQEHDVTVLEVPPGRTAAEAVARFDEPAKGAQIARFRGGIVAIPPGTHGFFTGDFHPGEYVVLCFVPDEHDGKPHYTHGMQQDITVQ